MLLDVTDVCERRGGFDGVKELRGKKKKSRPTNPTLYEAEPWQSDNRKKEIPVIVDLTSHRKPQQVLDLTEMDEPSIISSYLPPPFEPVAKSNRRLKTLRREREEALHKMTYKFHKVKTKGEREERSSSPSTYEKMMERVTRNVSISLCS